MPIGTWRVPTEFDMYITPDGLEYMLSAPNTRWVMNLTGSGMPPIEYVSQRGPYQHGETLLDFFLRPRVMQLLVRHNRNDRNAYWHQRLQILDVLRLNRQLLTGLRSGRLRKIFQDGRRLDIDVMIQQGPAFEPDKIDQWDQHSFQEVLRFIAHNPVFYNPDQHIQSILSTTGDSLIFPLNDPLLEPENTFDGIAGIVFTASSSTSNTIDYVGTWEEYPTIVITGPMQGIRIENETTGDILFLDYIVQAGETVTITLAYGQKTVVSSVNGNIIGFLSPDSDLATFRLIPGENIINVAAPGATSDSGVSFRWYDRYIGY